LGRFTADIEDTVNEAIQELKIENELKKIERTWRNQSLALAKYTGKNGQVWLEGLCGALTVAATARPSLSTATHCRRLTTVCC
jgi:hypothetical protein